MERLMVYYYQYYFNANHYVMVALALLQAHIVSTSEFIQRLLTSSSGLWNKLTVKQQNNSSISVLFL